jgi:phenylacetate-CoA ligase
MHINYNFLSIHLKALNLYRFKRKWLFFTTNELEILQLNRLKKLLLQFHENPFYGGILQKAGLTFQEIHNIDNIHEILSRLPILTKDDIHKHKEEMLNKNARGIFEDSSGGSTGTPLNFYHDETWLINMASTTLINDTMQGWYFFCPHVKLWGSPKDAGELDSVSGKILNIIRRRHFCDSFDMPVEKLWKYHADMEKFRPVVIFSYASSIYILANFLHAHGIDPSYPTRSIISTAECLDEQMRDKIQKVFKVPVYDRYGSREVGCIGGECEKHKGMHLHIYDHILECIDPRSGKPVRGGAGELIITDLNNYAFPFIRYRIGDWGILSTEKCNCGRNGPMLKKVLGRTTDTITTKSGRMVHGEYFTHVFYGVDGVSQFQFVQENREHYRLFIVKNENYQDDFTKSIVREINEVIGEDCCLEVHFVDEIPVTNSGKHRFTISKVPINIKS